MIAASRCLACGRAAAPPRARCPACGGAVAPATLPAEGTLLTWTVVMSAPDGFAPGFAVALVDLDGARVLAAAPGTAGFAVGARVRVRAEGARFVIDGV